MRTLWSIYSFMGLGMNGRKPTYISLTLDEENNDLTHTHDGIMCLSPSVWCKEMLWKQLSSNSEVDELSAIWGFMYLVGLSIIWLRSGPTKMVLFRGSVWLWWKLNISWNLNTSRFLMGQMSVKFIVGLEFIVEGFTWKTVLSASCAYFLPDRSFCLHCEIYLEL